MSGPNSARIENVTAVVPQELNKQLLLSGFFEDDFAGEIKQNEENNRKNEL